MKMMKNFQIQAEKDFKRLNEKITVCRKQLLQKKDNDFQAIDLKFKAQIKTFENKCGVERAQKRVFLEAFDPDKNINVSSFYAQCIKDNLKLIEESQQAGEEEQFDDHEIDPEMEDTEA